MKQYRKKPTIVYAYQTDKEEIIHTSEGDVKANVGDFIITENGKKYPCKPDIFAKKYEETSTIEKRCANCGYRMDNGECFLMRQYHDDIKYEDQTFWVGENFYCNNFFKEV